MNKQQNPTSLKVHRSGPMGANHNEMALKVRKGVKFNHNETALRSR